mgnify:CR=1 FL=1
MQNDNQSLAPTPQPPQAAQTTQASPPTQPNLPQTSVAVSPAAPTDITKHQSNMETLMMAFGILTILSLLVNNGFILKISAAVFLLVAIVSITRSMSMPKPQAVERSAPQPWVTSAEVTKKPTSPLKIIGIATLVIVGLPIIGYLGFFVLIMFMMMSGGGRMGT